jgi:hypothetical protein
MTANHDQSASCKILIGGKREAKESKTITRKFAAAKRTPPANNRLRCLALSFEGFTRASSRPDRLTAGASADTLIATKKPARRGRERETVNKGSIAK